MRKIKEIILFTNLNHWGWLVLFSFFFVIHIPAIINDSGHDNFYTSLSKSLIHGNLSILDRDIERVKGSDSFQTGDLISFNGRYYLPYPPGPAILLVPFILANPNYVNSVLIGVILSCLNILLIFCILTRLKIKKELIPWLVYGFLFGTSYWYILLSSHHVYGFAEIVSVTFLLLTLYELFGKARPLLLGIFLGMAFLSRQFTILNCLFVLFYFVFKYFDSDRNGINWQVIKKIILFLLTLFVFIFSYCLYNYFRFGNLFDTGYDYINFLGVLRIRVSEYGVFSYHYVPYNLYNYILKGFNINFTGSDLLRIRDMDPYGTGLLIASPFLIASFKADWNKNLKIFAWISIGLIFTGLLFYHNNGKDQVNASRFTLDFLPIMFVLAALGAKKIPAWLFKGMITYSVALNIIAFLIHFYFHTLSSFRL